MFLGTDTLVFHGFFLRPRKSGSIKSFTSCLMVLAIWGMSSLQKNCSSRSQLTLLFFMLPIFWVEVCLRRSLPSLPSSSYLFTLRSQVSLMNMVLIKIAIRIQQTCVKHISKSFMTIDPHQDIITQSSPPHQDHLYITEGRTHWLLNLATLLLVYAYIKESLQFPPILTLVFSFVSLYKWASQPIIHSRHYLRLAYLLPCYFFFIFAVSFSMAIKNEGGHTGGLDDAKWIVKHRSCFQWLVYAVVMHFLMLEIHQRITNRGREEVEKEGSIFRDICGALAAPVSICSGGACHSFYASTITSILSSFSLPLAIVTPFLNLLVYAMQIMGLVSLYSVKGFRYGPLWVFFAGFLSQFVITSVFLSSVLMVGAVVWNAKFNKFTFGKKRSSI